MEEKKMATDENDCYSSAGSEKDQQQITYKNTEEDEQQKYVTTDNLFPEQCENEFNSLHVDTLVIGTPQENDPREIASPRDDDDVDEEEEVNQEFETQGGTIFDGGDVIFIIKQDNDSEDEQPDHEEACEFKVGTTFDHYSKVVKAIQAYERKNHVRLYRRDSRTLSSIINRGRAPKKNFSMDLRYGELCYRCRHGGKKYKSFSTGIRPNQSSFKQGCEMHIRFGVSDDGTQLVVKSMSEEHNHEINEESVVKEALHPDLCTYVSKLVWSDTHISIDDVKKKLENFVCDEMFKDQTPPPRTRRQYFPSKKQIRYFMAKAKSSLTISQEAEIKLEAQAEQLKETRGDEKMLFNFKVSHPGNLMDSELSINNEESMGDPDDELFTGTEQIDETKPTETQLLNEANSSKILFCHQTPHQQRLMRRYSTQVILTQINDIYSKIPFPLFCLYVQTNVDFQLVGEIILQANTCTMVIEGLQTLKEWNPGWCPKFVIVDFSEEQITAAEHVFPGSFVLISDTSREKAWSDWLSLEENEAFQYKEEILSYLQNIATSYSEDMLNRAARELEDSDVWKMSDKLRNWFQLHWLSQAKRWVTGYRPDDYLLLVHNGRSLQMELEVFKSIKLVNKTAPLKDVIQQIVEHVAPLAKEQYEQLNRESFKLQTRLKYVYPDIPKYLSCRPGKLTHHVYERVKLASQHAYSITYLHPGIFSVQCCGTEDDIMHTVSFGDLNSFPSCDCLDWLVCKLPCVHLCAVFNSYPEWTWDMLSVPYKSSAVFSVDWCFAPGHSEHLEQRRGNIIDKSTQTADVSLSSNTSQLSKLVRMGDQRRLTETPQVLASQCRGLLQQLTKLQLAHHNRDDLYRLKSNLKDLISIFSTSTKNNSSATNVSSTRVTVPSKGSFSSQKVMPRKLPTHTITSSSRQNVSRGHEVHFTTGEDTASSCSQTPSSETILPKPLADTPSAEKSLNNIIGTVYIVNSNDASGTSQNMITPTQLQAITNEQIQSIVKLKSIARKRINSPSSVFLKPQDKRLKPDMSSFPTVLSLDFTGESVGGDVRSSTVHSGSLDEDVLNESTLLTVDEQSIPAVQLEVAFTDSDTVSLVTNPPEASNTVAMETDTLSISCSVMDSVPASGQNLGAPNSIVTIVETGKVIGHDSQQTPEEGVT